MASLPRICIFSLAYAPFESGAEIAVREIAHRLAPRFRFTCITHRFDRHWPTAQHVGNVEVHRVGFGGDGPQDYYGQRFAKMLYPFLALREAIRLHRMEHFQMVWLVMASYGWPAALLFKFLYPRVPLLLTLQEGDSERYILGRISIFYYLWRLIFCRADTIQAISNYLSSFASRHGATCPIEVVPNGVIVSESKTPHVQRKIFDVKHPVIITASRLVYKNGVDILIKAVAELRRLGRNVRCLVVGGGPDDRALRQLAYKLGVADVVEFIGAVPAADVPRYLARADIFVRPSRTEGLGNSFLEAMAAGLPVIGTAVGGIPDFLKSPDVAGPTQATGMFAAVDDAQDLAQKIIFFIDHADLRNVIAHNGRVLVLRAYTWESVALRMGNMFSRLISASTV